MGNSGGKKKEAQKSRITEQDKAVLQLKQMRDKLRQYKNRIETKLENERQLAKELVQQGKTDKAKLLLKKKRFYENNLLKSDQQMDNIDQMIHTLEFTQIEHEVVKGLKVGNDCLKKLHELMSLDEIEDIMDDTREAIEHQRKIDELLGTQINEEDMEEINKEFEEIVQEQTKLPDVPTHELEPGTKSPVKQKEKEKVKKVAVMAD